MPDCASLPGCPFFNNRMSAMPGTAEIYKKKYCRNDFNTCARFMVSKALGKDRVPADLYPNMRDRAEQLILAG